jgi:hypothetical protein
MCSFQRSVEFLLNRDRLIISAVLLQGFLRKKNLKYSGKSNSLHFINTLELNFAMLGGSDVDGCSLGVGEALDPLEPINNLLYFDHKLYELPLQVSLFKWTSDKKERLKIDEPFHIVGSSVCIHRKGSKLSTFALLSVVQKQASFID